MLSSVDMTFEDYLLEHYRFKSCQILQIPLQKLVVLKVTSPYVYLIEGYTIISKDGWQSCAYVPKIWCKYLTVYQSYDLLKICPYGWLLPFLQTIYAINVATPWRLLSCESKHTLFSEMLTRFPLPPNSMLTHYRDRIGPKTQHWFRGRGGGGVVDTTSVAQTLFMQKPDSTN